MQRAPSVSYPVGRPLSAGLLLAVLWSAGALACGSWAVQSDHATALAIAAAACISAGSFAGTWWWRSPLGSLEWDGARWSWTAAPGGGPLDAGQATAVLDLQQVVLLRCAGEGPRWLWLERSALPARWPALRRAVYSPADSPVPGEAQPPSARP